MAAVAFYIQLRLYAKYSSPLKIEVGTNVLMQAECYDNLDRDYLRSVKTRMYLSYCLCLPLIVITTLVVVVRSLRVPITSKLSNSLNHPSVAGLVLTGIFLHLFCLAMDMAAVRFMYLGRELKDIPAHANVHGSLNFFATGITLGINIIISVLLIICLAYLHCQHILDPSRFLFKQVFQRILSPLFYVVFGEFDQDDYWKSIYKEETKRTDSDEKRIRQHTAWVVCFMLLAPLFSLASHVGYIFAAWLTEPSKTTAVALIFLGVMVFLFVMLRQCYMTNERVQVEEKWKNCFILCYPFIQVLKCTSNCICLCICMKAYCQPQTKRSSGNLLEVKNDQTSNGSADPKKGRKKRKQGRKDQVEVMLEPIEDLLKEQWEVNHFFNTRAFCVAFAWGWPLLGSIAFFLSAFYELPVASYTLPLYLLNAFQVFIVIITLLITYKMLQITEPVFHVFLRNMKDAYINRARHVPEDSKVKMEGDEVVSTATLMGELAGVIVHELQKSPATNEADTGRVHIPVPRKDEMVQHVTLNGEIDGVIVHELPATEAAQTEGPMQKTGGTSSQSTTVSQHVPGIDSTAATPHKKPGATEEADTGTESPSVVTIGSHPKSKIHQRRRYTGSTGSNSSLHAPVMHTGGSPEHSTSDETTPLLKSV